MATKALTFAIAIASVVSGCNSHSEKNDIEVANIPQQEIRDLSYAIKAASSYRKDMRMKLDSIEDILVSAPTDIARLDLSLELANRFRPINTDSSLFYAYKAKTIAEHLETSDVYKARIAIINALATAGLFTQALEEFHSLPVDEFSPAIKIEYWTAGRRLFGYMKGYTSGNQEFYITYDELYQQYDDSLLSHLPQNNRFRRFIECERLVTRKKYVEAREKLELLIRELPQESNLYGMTAFQIAEVWRNLGDDNKYAAMLALSALSDVKGCVTEGLALPTLAEWLYEQGELGESFSFINFALEEASGGNARMRAVTIARFVPLIDEAYRNKINSSRDELMIYFILVTVLLTVTAILTVFLFKQIKKSRANEKKLAHTSRTQESYIGNFIGLYSGYAERLNQLRKLVSTKLASGQIAELKKLIDSGKFTDQNNEDIHKIFDSAFLDIYPDFPERINSLLRPEETIVVKDKTSLTPELRIYAFVKLGIDESSRIARILHYSINTVYAYRNKMRNKAIHRDTFDSDVKEL